MNFMTEVTQSLAEIGFQGDCLELEHLRYSVRVGACSWQYLELVKWLEQQFIDSKHGAASKTMIELDFAPLFHELRSSFLKITSGAPNDPLKMRWTILQYLINVLKMAFRNERRLSSTPELRKKQIQASKLDVRLARERGLVLNGTQNTRLQRAADCKLMENSQANEDQLNIYDTNYVLEKCMDAYNSINHGATLQYLVINNASPTGEICKTHWQRIKNTLEEYFLVVEENNNDITAAEANGIYFDKLMHNNQLRVVVCKHAISAELLRLSFEQLSQQEQVSLLPYCESNIEFVLTAWVWIGQTYKDPSMILDLITLHNTLSTENWCVIKIGPAAGSGHHYLLKLDRSALPTLERNGGYLNFGQCKLYMRLNKELRADFDFLSLEIGRYARNLPAEEN